LILVSHGCPSCPYASPERPFTGFRLRYVDGYLRSGDFIIRLVDDLVDSLKRTSAPNPRDAI
jgi:hypothetical protein